MSFLRGFAKASSISSARIVVPSTTSQKPFRSSSFSRTAGGIAAFSLFGFSFGGTSNSNSSNASSISESSSLLREKSPAAYRKSATTLVFVSAGSASQKELRESRDKWYNWIAYFREAGFNCLDVNLNVSDSAKADCDSVEKEATVLGEELSSQIALASLQRQPLVFVRSSGGSIAQALFTSSSRSHSQPSGIVLIAGNGAPLASSQGFPNKLLVAVISPEGAKLELEGFGGKVEKLESDGDADGEKAMREVERWMMNNGFD